MKARNLIPVFAAAALASSAIAAEPPAAVGLTLDAAIRVALKNHPRLAEARAQWTAAEQRAIQAGLRPNPQLVAGVEELPFSGGPGKADYLVGVTQQIRSDKTVKLTREIAEAEREKSAQLLRSAANEVNSRVHAAFAAAHYAQASERLFVERIGFLESAHKLALSLAEAGEIIPGAAEIAHSKLDHELLDHEEALALRAQAFLALATEMGTPDKPVDSVHGDLAADLGIDQLQQAAAKLDNLPGLQAAANEEAILRLRAELARASRIPAVNLGLLYRRKQGADANALDLQASIPLPLFDNKKAAAAAFEADADAARSRREQLRREARLSIGQLTSDLRMTLQRLEHIREEILPHKERIVRRHQLLFEAGEIDRLDYTHARLAATGERRHQLETLRETHRLWAELRKFSEARP